MNVDSSHTADVTSRPACQHVVRALIEKYDWALLGEDELVALVMGSTLPEASAAELEKLARQHYQIVLHQACQQAEDPDRREQGYRELFRYLYRAAYNRWPELAEEVAQQALVLVYEQIDRCRHPGAFLTFAFYKLLEAFKREKRLINQVPSLEEIGQGNAKRLSTAFQSRLDREERLQALVGAIRDLPDRRQQQAILLKFFGGLSDEVIGERLGVTLNNVRVLRHRGIQQLREDEGLTDYFLNWTRE